MQQIIKVVSHVNGLPVISLNRGVQNIQISDGRIVVVKPEAMSAAINETRKKILENHGPFGAAITDMSGKLITIGINSVTKEGNPILHAETTAITQVSEIRKKEGAAQPYIMSDYILYSTCEPCPMCIGAIHWARIPVVVYGTNINDAATAGLGELRASSKSIAESEGHSILLVVMDYMREESLKIFKDWMALTSKQNY